MLRRATWAVALSLLALSHGRAAEALYVAKTANTPVPQEVPAGIGKELDTRSVQVLDAKGVVLYELWPRKEIPSDAAEAQVKNGLTYQELKETTLVGVLQVHQLGGDYRKQKLKPGVYTLRFGLQPMDGDHMGTAPQREFCLLVPAKDEKSPAPLESAKELQERSTKASGTGHPAVLLLFPYEKPADMPQVQDKGNNHWALSWKQPVKAAGQKAALGFSLTVIGHSAAE